MDRRGNAAVIVIIVLVAALGLFLAVPAGGKIGLLREATISFIFRTPPKFIALQASVDGIDMEIPSGSALTIKGEETVIITGIKANTFFQSYLTADVPGFGNDNDLHEPLNAAEIRQQLINAGIRSMPIEIYYLDRNIAKVPLTIDLTEDDFHRRIRAAAADEEKIAILKNAHKNFPANEDFLSQLDDILNRKGDFETLVGIYRALVKADPENIPAQASLSRYYLKLGMLTEALETSQYIVDKGRATATTYRRLGYIAGQLGMGKERIDYLSKALELDPGNESIVLDLGTTHEQMGNRAKALELYRQYAKKASRKDILVPVIEDSLKRKDFKEARDLLEHYIKTYPQDAEAYAQLGMVMGRLGKTTDQIKYYKKAAELDPRDGVKLHNLAVAYDKKGKGKEALATYADLMKIKPDDKDALKRAAALALELKRYREAYTYYGNLIDKDAQITYIKGLINAAAGLKDNDKIIRACNLYLKKKQDYNVLLILAQAYEARAASGKDADRVQDLQSALDTYRQALKLNPQSTKAQEKIPDLRIKIIKLQKLAQT